jgi:DNA-binding transcriptional MerR regulator
MADQYSIRDLAREFEITSRTLRFYEEKGLLSPTREGQNRIYSRADRTRLRLILRGKRLGLTLEESADLIGMYDPGSDNQQQLLAVIDKIRESRRRLEQQKQDLEQMLSDLADWEARTEQEVQALIESNKQTDAQVG